MTTIEDVQLNDLQRRVKKQQFVTEKDEEYTLPEAKALDIARELDKTMRPEMEEYEEDDPDLKDVYEGETKKKKSYITTEEEEKLAKEEDKRAINETDFDRLSKKEQKKQLLKSGVGLSVKDRKERMKEFEAMIDRIEGSVKKTIRKPIIKGDDISHEEDFKKKLKADKKLEEEKKKRKEQRKKIKEEYSSSSESEEEDKPQPKKKTAPAPTPTRATRSNKEQKFIELSREAEEESESESESSADSEKDEEEIVVEDDEEDEE
jgi:hypothetical protein